MAFPQINTDQKQHLNLSEEAWLILEQDRAAFGGDNLTGFLNHILLNYCEQAEASLFRTRQKKLQEYQKNLSGLPEEYRTRAAEILADRDIKIIQERVRSYKKGHSFKFRLNNELVAYLTEEPGRKSQVNNCREDQYYEGHIGLYLKALLEEYARLPYLEREKICFAPYFVTIKNCIKSGNKIKVQVSSGNEYLMRPYQVMTDAQSTYHYLIAWSDEEDRPFSYRISSLQCVRQTSQGGKLTAEKKKRIEQALQEKDVPYIAGTVQKIRVQLTLSGINKYQSILHLRPQCHSIEDENIYVFHCTTYQAEYYFSKFGPDATVLSPEKLADKLRRFHLRALKNYDRQETSPAE